MIPIIQALGFARLTAMVNPLLLFVELFMALCSIGVPCFSMYFGLC